MLAGNCMTTCWMVQNLGGQDKIGPVNIQMLKTPEELAQIEEEKQKVKEEKRLQAEAPMARARKWLNALPRHTETGNTLLQTIRCSSVPADKKADLEACVLANLNVMKSKRDDLEAAIAAKDIPESLLKDAAFYTVELKNASSRWVQIIQVYSGSSKGL